MLPLDPQPIDSSWRSALAPAALSALIEEHTHLRDGPFSLTWKLSGAGIVGRVMDLPATEKVFVGRKTPFGYELAVRPDATHRHAFEPIAEVHINAGAGQLPDDDPPAPPHPHAGDVEDTEPPNDGRDGPTEVRLHLRLHREQRSFALPFALMGVACLAGAVFAVGQPLQAGMSALVGAAFVALPPMRSRSLFRHGCGRVEAAIRETLGLDRA